MSTRKCVLRGLITSIMSDVEFTRGRKGGGVLFGDAGASREAGMSARGWLGPPQKEARLWYLGAWGKSRRLKLGYDGSPEDEYGKEGVCVESAFEAHSESLSYLDWPEVLLPFSDDVVYDFFRGC